MSDKAKERVDMRVIKADYSPDKNPLVDPYDIKIRRRRVRSGLRDENLVNTTTGEITAASVIHLVEDKDDEQFVKIFAAGIAASYELTRTGQRVFQSILKVYEDMPMSNGFVDSVYLAWFGDGLSGEDIGMSERTFNRGLRELLEKGFIAPKTPNLYWVNPALFFKGNRAVFVKEYRKVSTTPPPAPEKSVEQEERESLEKEEGQQRLID